MGAVGEQFLEHPAHREHGRSRVHREATAIERVHLATRAFVAFQQRDPAAGTRQVDGRSQAAHSRADHGDARLCGGHRQPWVGTLIAAV